MATETLFLVMIALLVSRTSQAAERYWFDGDRKLVITEAAGRTMDFTPPQDGRKSAAPREPKISPVFHDGRSTTGRMRALPGGIFVQFKTDWTEEQIRRWCDSNHLPIEKKLNLRGNWYVLRTEAGLVGLETANRIHESGEVVSASPNWWQEVRPR